MPEASLHQPKRRRRPALACVQCRARKVRCDRTSPCNNCLKYPGAECTYSSAVPVLANSSRNDRSSEIVVNGPRASDLQHHIPTGTSSSVEEAGDASLRGSAATANAQQYLVPEHPSPSPSVSSLLRRIKQLECQIEERDSAHGSRDDISRSSAQPSKSDDALPLRTMRHKTRIFGQSHWMSGFELLPLFLELAQKALTDPSSDLFRADAKVKKLGRAIKAQRIPTLAFPLTQVGQEIGQKDLADSLVECYLRTSEATHRVLHVPSFRLEYGAFWSDPASAKPSFIVLLQLCMAIGACFHDEEFSLRTKAVRWVYEAELWLVSPSDKKKMGLEDLQIRCLLMIAKQYVGLGADLTWITAGSLLRTGMYMGLHRDPRHSGAPRRTLRTAEMRRRLWATILELSIQASLDAGGPPLISAHDFDAEAPGNFEDAQLADNVDDGAITPSELGTYTEASVQIALLASFPSRLAIATALNQFHAGLPYEEVLRLSSRLLDACQAMRRHLRAFPRANSNRTGITEYQLRVAELVTRRFLIALHVPILGRGLGDRDPAYSFSRKTCLDTSLHICQLAGLLSSPRNLAPDIPAEFDRLVTSASGLRRTTVFQSIVLVGIELITRTEERKSFGLSVALGDAELRAILESAVSWAVRSIKAGETNCKGYVVLHAFLAHIDATDAGLNPTETMEAMEARASSALVEIYEVLKATPAGCAAADVGTPRCSDLEALGALDDEMNMDLFHGWEDMSGLMAPGMNFERDGSWDIGM